MTSEVCVEMKFKAIEEKHRTTSITCLGDDIYGNIIGYDDQKKEIVIETATKTFRIKYDDMLEAARS